MGQFFKNHTDNQKLELEKMFPLHDIRLHQGFNFHVRNYLTNQFKQVTTQVKYKTMLVLN